MFKGIKNWLDIRIGWDELGTTIKQNRVPKNINIFQTLGVVVLAGFIIEAVSGLFLLIYYVPHADHAFASVQKITNDVPYGWLFRQMHVVGGNLMIAAVLLHMLSVFVMGSYKRPRELTWIFGGLLLLLTFAFGLSGYLLPWSQLSYWATTVVTSMPTAIPVIGDSLSMLLRGGESVTSLTLTRFFAFHVAIIPLIFLLLMGIHIFFVLRTGISTSPYGEVSEEEKRPWNEYKKIPHPSGHRLFPYFFEKEGVMVFVYISIMFFIMTFLPNLFFPHTTITPADPLNTPELIRPEWYFLAPYQLLKTIPNKFFGVVLQLIIIAVFLLWPFIDIAEERNILKKPLLRGSFLLAVAVWFIFMFWGRA
jgi:ubiquinol-cytochrome c reductase cytochrome b subunit